MTQAEKLSSYFDHKGIIRLKQIKSRKIAMRCPKILLFVLISVVAPNLALITGFSFAQTSSNQKAEVTRLLNQGMVLLNNQQKYQDTLQILQQALAIFRAIQNQSGEAKSIQVIGDVYLSFNIQQQFLSILILKIGQHLL